MHVTTAKPTEDADVYRDLRPNLKPVLRFPSVTPVHHDIDNSDRWFQFQDFRKQYGRSKRECNNHRSRASAETPRFPLLEEKG